MYSRHQLRRRILLSLQGGDLMDIPCCFYRQVTQPTVRVDPAFLLDSLLNKRQQTCRGSVRNTTHSDPPDPRTVLLCGNNNQRLALRLASASTLFQATQISLIHLDPPCQPVASRADHRATQFVQPCPGSFVASQSQHSLQSQCAGAGLLSCHPIHGAKPVCQWLACVLEDRSRSHRGLVAARTALHQHNPHWPVLSAPATRAPEALRPAQPEQIIPAGLLSRKFRSEFAQTARIFLHRPPYYMLGSPESSKYPPSFFRWSSHL